MKRHRARKVASKDGNAATTAEHRRYLLRAMQATSLRYRKKRVKITLAGAAGHV